LPAEVSNATGGKASGFAVIGGPDGADALSLALWNRNAL